MSPHAKRFTSLSAIVGLLALGWMVLLLGQSSWTEPTFTPILQGTQFGQTALIAAWLTVGPFPLARRFALASIWFAAVVLAVGFNRSLVKELYEYNLVLTCGLMSLSQIVLITIPLSGVTAFYGWRFVWGDDSSAASKPDRQIGIREALVLTAAVALVLGAARYQYGDLRDVKIKWHYAAECAFFTVASVVLGVPAIVTNLVSRRWLWPLIIAIIWSALVMLLEILLVQVIIGTRPLHREPYLLAFLINATEAAWIFAVVTLLKRGGYRVVSNRSQLTVAASTIQA